MFMVKKWQPLKLSNKSNILPHLCRSFPDKVGDYISDKMAAKILVIMLKYRQAVRNAKPLIAMIIAEVPQQLYWTRSCLKPRKI